MTNLENRKAIENPANKELLRLTLIIAILYSIAIVWLGDFFYSLIKEQPFYFDEDVIGRFARMIIAFLPFGIFRSFMNKAELNRGNFIKSQVLGFLISFGLWTLYFCDGIYYKGGGANIGLGILLMLSPAFIFALMWFFYKWKMRSGAPRNINRPIT